MARRKQITKKRIKEYVQSKLKEDPRWTVKGLLKIHAAQTPREKACGIANVKNNIGFTGVDAEILTSFADQWKSKGRLSQRQWEILAGRMPKYWRQIILLCDHKKLMRGMMADGFLNEQMELSIALAELI